MENGIGNHKNFTFDDFRLETERQTLRRGLAEIHLAKRPFDVLLFLIESRERVVSRDELLDKFWDGHEVYDDALRKCVGAIRKALDDTDKSPNYIETRRGSGYRFVGDVFEELGGEKSRRGNNKTETAGGWRLAAAANGNRRTPKFEERRQAADSSFIFATTGRRTILFAVIGLIVFSISTLAFFNFRRQTTAVESKTLIQSAAERRSIAILPLRNLTGDTANDYLSDGITESLINEISRVEALKVISRGSAFQFKDKDVSAQEIGYRLGVESILEGSLRQNGDSLRVEVRLVDTKDGRVKWTSDSEQKKLADIFAIQDGITCQIVTDLKVKLCGEVPPAARYTQNVQAYRLYLRGLYYRNRLGAEDLRKAIEFFNQALQIDPNYALAHEGLASTYTVMEFNAIVPPGTVVELAESHAARALELDDSLVGAYIALGAIKTIQNYDLAQSERYYRQALLKNPNHRTAHLWLANNLTVHGKFEEAETEILRAQDIDPLSMGVHLTLAELYWYWRKPDKVIEQANLMLSVDPDGGGYGLLARAFVQKSDFENAYAMFEKIPPDNLMRLYVFSAAGRTAEARKFAETVAASDIAKNSPYKIGCAYALIGDKETAFTWLEKSYAERQADLISIKIDPALESLHDDARYQDLLQRVGLAD